MQTSYFRDYKYLTKDVKKLSQVITKNYRGIQVDNQPDYVIEEYCRRGSLDALNTHRSNQFQKAIIPQRKTPMSQNRPRIGWKRCCSKNKEGNDDIELEGLLSRKSGSVNIELKKSSSENNFSRIADMLKQGHKPNEKILTTLTKLSDIILLIVNQHKDYNEIVKAALPAVLDFLIIDLRVKKWDVDRRPVEYMKFSRHLKTKSLETLKIACESGNESTVRMFYDHSHDGVNMLDCINELIMDNNTEIKHMAIRVCKHLSTTIPDELIKTRNGEIIATMKYHSRKLAVLNTETDCSKVIMPLNDHDQTKSDKMFNFKNIQNTFQGTLQGTLKKFRNGKPERKDSIRSLTISERKMSTDSLFVDELDAPDGRRSSVIDQKIIEHIHKMKMTQVRDWSAWSLCSIIDNLKIKSNDILFYNHIFRRGVLKVLLNLLKSTNTGVTSALKVKASETLVAFSSSLFTLESQVEDQLTGNIQEEKTGQSTWPQNDHDQRITVAELAKELCDQIKLVKSDEREQRIQQLLHPLVINLKTDCPRLPDKRNKLVLDIMKVIQQLFEAADPELKIILFKLFQTDFEREKKKNKVDSFWDKYTVRPIDLIHKQLHSADIFICRSVFKIALRHIFTFKSTLNEDEDNGMLLDGLDYHKTNEDSSLCLTGEGSIHLRGQPNSSYINYKSMRSETDVSTDGELLCGWKKLILKSYYEETKLIICEINWGDRPPNPPIAHPETKKFRFKITTKGKFQRQSNGLIDKKKLLFGDLNNNKNKNNKVIDIVIELHQIGKDDHAIETRIINCSEFGIIYKHFCLSIDESQLKSEYKGLGRCIAEILKDKHMSRPQSKIGKSKSKVKNVFKLSDYKNARFREPGKQSIEESNSDRRGKCKLEDFTYSIIDNKINAKLSVVDKRTGEEPGDYEIQLSSNLHLLHVKPSKDSSKTIKYTLTPEGIDKAYVNFEKLRQKHIENCVRFFPASISEIKTREETKRILAAFRNLTPENAENALKNNIVYHVAKLLIDTTTPTQIDPNGLSLRTTETNGPVRRQSIRSNHTVLTSVGSVESNGIRVQYQEQERIEDIKYILECLIDFIESLQKDTAKFHWSLIRQTVKAKSRMETLVNRSTRAAKFKLKGSPTDVLKADMKQVRLQLMKAGSKSVIDDKGCLDRLLEMTKHENNSIQRLSIEIITKYLPIEIMFLVKNLSNYMDEYDNISNNEEENKCQKLQQILLIIDAVVSVDPSSNATQTALGHLKSWADKSRKTSLEMLNEFLQPRYWYTINRDTIMIATKCFPFQVYKEKKQSIYRWIFCENIKLSLIAIRNLIANIKTKSILIDDILNKKVKCQKKRDYIDDFPFELFDIVELYVNENEHYDFEIIAQAYEILNQIFQFIENPAAIETPQISILRDINIFGLFYETKKRNRLLHGVNALHFPRKDFCFVDYSRTELKYTFVNNTAFREGGPKKDGIIPFQATFYIPYTVLPFGYRASC